MHMAALSTMSFVVLAIHLLALPALGNFSP